MAAARSRRYKLGFAARVPGIGPFALEDIGYVQDGLLCCQNLIACRTIKCSDGDSPDPLPRNAPVRTIGNHAGDSFFAPFRNPFYFTYFVQSPASKGIGFHGDEPLGCGPENHRIVAAPTVRIRVGKARGMQKQTSLFYQPTNLAIALK